jgi:hypothetical protein
MTRNRSVPFSKTLLVVLGMAPMGLVPFDVLPSGRMPVSTISWGINQFGLTEAHAQSSDAMSRDPIVTSDTPEYCGVLMNRITGITRTTASPPPTEAAVLSEEGERMCVHGQTRGGILRLRRALEIIRHGED